MYCYILFTSSRDTAIEYPLYDWVLTRCVYIPQTNISWQWLVAVSFIKKMLFTQRVFINTVCTNNVLNYNTNTKVIMCNISVKQPTSSCKGIVRVHVHWRFKCGIKIFNLQRVGTSETEKNKHNTYRRNIIASQKRYFTKTYSYLHVYDCWKNYQFVSMLKDYFPIVCKMLIQNAFW